MNRLPRISAFSRLAVVCGWAAVAALVALTPLAARGVGTDATLRKVGSRIDGGSGIVTIEASDPVPYVASQPDPRTFVIELRDVIAGPVSGYVRSDTLHPVEAVRVEQGRAMDGASVTRVSMSLAYATRPKVRSSRNVITVEAELGGAAGGAPAISLAGPSTVIRDVRVAKRGTATAVTLVGTPVAPAAAAQSVGAAPPDLGAVVVPRPAQATPAGQAVGAAQAPGAPPAPAADPASPAPRYTGHPVSLDFQGADLRAVLRTFSEISGLNVVIDPAIQGSVDVALRDVPWDQALDIILRANRLGYNLDGTIVRIAPLTSLAEEETQRRKLQDEQALAGELRVYTRALSYAKAEDLRALLTATAISQRGSIQTDARTNTIIINDLPERIDRAAALLTTLDVPQQQVEIEARIVQTNRSFASRLGVQWGLGGRAIPSLGNTAPLAFPNQGSLTGRTGAVQGAPGQPDSAVGSVVNLAAGGASSAIGLALGSVNGALNLDVALSALEQSGQGRILSTPRVSTQNNIEAEITQGIQIPIQTVSNNTVTVSFRDAALTLKVTPQITAAGTVIMRISVVNESPDFSRSVNGIPPIDTQRALTQVLVSDGETTVIGGIYVSREQSTQDRTPGLYRLPLLGWLFKRDLAEDESRELLIFITPKIVRL